jgi:hypothetical protein
MYKYLLFLLFLCPFIAFSQGSFAPIGAEWWYDYLLANRVTPYGLPAYMQSSGNATVDGQICRKLNVTEIDFGYKLFVYSRNDSVFLYDPTWNSKWRLLYDYSAGPGDSWEIPAVRDLTFNKDTTMTVTVDSVGTVEFCNQTLKAWYISYDTTRFKWGRQIVERIGNTFTFRPYLNERPTCPAYIRCYSDPDYTCKAVPYRCDTTWASASEPVLDWSVHPNPVRDVLEVSITSNAPQDFTLVLYELTTGQTKP